MLALLMFASVIGLALIGCAKPEAPTPAPAPAPAPTPAKVFTLKFAEYLPEASLSVKVGDIPFVEACEKRSGGRLKIEFYPGETLVKSSGMLEAGMTGVADIVACAPGYFPDKLPMNTIWELPMLGYSNRTEGVKVAEQVQEKYLDIDLKAVNMHYLGAHQCGVYMIFSTKKPLKSVDDFKGMLVRSYGPTQSVMMEMLGATPVPVKFGEIYEALQKGTCDATMHDVTSILQYKWGELADPGYVLESPGGGLGSANILYLINGDVWNSLPTDLQQILAEEGENRTWNQVNAYNDWEGGQRTKIADLGITFSTADEAGIAKLKEVAKVVQHNWAVKMDEKGLPGTEFMEEFTKIAAAIK